MHFFILIYRILHVYYISCIFWVYNFNHIDFIMPMLRNFIFLLNNFAMCTLMFKAIFKASLHTQFLYFYCACTYTGTLLIPIKGLRKYYRNVGLNAQ